MKGRSIFVRIPYTCSATNSSIGRRSHHSGLALIYIAMKLVTLFTPFLFPVTLALKIIDVLVPRYADLKQSVVLKCSFDVGHDKLYSVKWYKDDHEFYRFVPEDRPTIQVFHLPGIMLDLSHCNIQKITLRNLTLQTSGIYRCEVSTDGPKFEMVFKSANMNVLAYPEGVPLIEGVLNRYAVGDLVSGNCTSSKSYPQPLMTWYVNGIQASNNQVESYPVLVNPEGTLYSKAVGIRFKVEKDHFQGPDKELDLTCEASLLQGQLKWRKMIVIQSLTESYMENMFLEKYRNNINTTKPSKIFNLYLILFIQNINWIKLIVKQLSTLMALFVISFTRMIVHKT